MKNLPIGSHFIIKSFFRLSVLRNS